MARIIAPTIVETDKKFQYGIKIYDDTIIDLNSCYISSKSNEIHYFDKCNDEIIIIRQLNRRNCFCTGIQQNFC